MHHISVKFMTWIKRFKEKKEEAQQSSFTNENGSWLHEELVTTFNGRHKVPLRIFSAQELIRATNNFIDPINGNTYIKFCKGSLEQCPILVKNVHNSFPHQSWRREQIHDIVIGSQMSCHKNAWKLLGCCLEFKVPAMVYEYDDEGGGFDFLSDLLFRSNIEERRRKLSCTSRLKIANEIANAIAYLHLEFATPFIYRYLCTQNVIIDQYGVAKLFDFSLSVSLPPGELDLEVERVGGLAEFMAPEYAMYGIVSQKTDVYAFGMLLLVLITGRNASVDSQFSRIATSTTTTSNPKQISQTQFTGKSLPEYVAGKELNEIMDPIMMRAEAGGTEHDQQLLNLLQLSLNCIKTEGGDRPEMIDVARATRQIRTKRYSSLRNSEVSTASIASTSTDVAPEIIHGDHVPDWIFKHAR